MRRGVTRCGDDPDLVLWFDLTLATKTLLSEEEECERLINQYPGKKDLNYFHFITKIYIRNPIIVSKCGVCLDKFQKLDKKIDIDYMLQKYESPYGQFFYSLKFGNTQNF